MYISVTSFDDLSVVDHKNMLLVYHTYQTVSMLALNLFYHKSLDGQRFESQESFYLTLDSPLAFNFSNYENIIFTEQNYSRPIILL